MKKIFVTVLTIVSFSSLLLSQELLVNGTFDDGLEGWTHWNILDGAIAGVAEVMDDDGGPAEGSGSYLFMSCEGNTYFNQMLWQPIEITVGDTIAVDGAFIDFTYGELHNYWCEIFIGSLEPDESADYTHNKLYAFNTWTGCGPNVDGTFMADACENYIPDGYWIVPDSMGTGTFTGYFILKTGIWTDGSEGELYYQVGIDSLSAYKIGGSTSAVKNEHPTAPAGFELTQNYPNPFNPSTTIRYTLPQAAQVELAVYDIQGKLVQTLTSQMMNAGEHSIEWNATNADGQPMPSGIYFYTLQTESFSETHRMVLLK